MITGGQGQVSKRKRVKGKIGEVNYKPELKFCSCINPSATHAYENVFFPGIHRHAWDNTQMWKPYMLQWPLEGPGADERIGKRIRVKYLRIKGYACSSPFLIDQVRWRLVLYRTKKNFGSSGGQIIEEYPMDWLYELYNKSYDMEVNGYADVQLAAVNMFYQSYFNPEQMRDLDCKRRILMRGIFNPSQDIGNYTVPQHNITGTAGGSGATLSVAQHTSKGYYQRHFTSVDIGHVANMSACFPIDLTVTLNDNVDCDDYRYLLVFESDCVIGQDVAGTYTLDVGTANYIFSLIAQIYYTDE